MQLKQCMQEAAFETLGVQSNGKSRSTLKSCWWTDDLEELIKEKKILYQKWLATGESEDRKTYARCRYYVKNAVKRAKNLFWEKKCADIDKQLGSSRSKAAWSTLKTLRTNTREKLAIDPINPKEWTEYYKNLLTEKRTLYSEVTYDIENVAWQNEDITTQDVINAIKTMKNNKSAGPGGIPIELIKNAPILMIESLASIFNKCIRGGEVPSEWKMAHISSIYKKGSKTDCSNYRGISVTASIGRLYGRILKTKIERHIQDIEEQCGFRAGRSCVDNIFCLKQLIEKTNSRGNELHLIFIDLKKAYDSIPVNKLWEAMEISGVHKQCINAVKILYCNTKSCVKTTSGYSDPFIVNKGLRQGCCLSPTLFKIYLNVALGGWSRKCSRMGVQLNDNSIHTLLFADDQVVLAEDADDANYMIRKLIEQYDEWGLEINPQKTQYMVIGAEGEDIVTTKGTIKITKEYKYLGVTITDDGTDEKDILNKLGQGRAITRSLHSVIWSKDITRKTKIHMYQTLVESCTTYGSEVWTISKRLEKRINAVEMGYWRRCCGKTLLDHIPNEEIRKEMRRRTPLTSDIEERQLVWFGHMKRMPEYRLPQKVYYWKPWNRRKRGRPRKTWMDGIERAMTTRQLKEEECQHRESWRLGCRKRPINI